MPIQQLTPVQTMEEDDGNDVENFDDEDHDLL